jgi:amidohydrolase
MNAPEMIPSAQQLSFDALIAERTKAINAKLIALRRDLHEHPELGNREFRTSKLVADHLRAVGFDDVKEKVAYTGVVGLLKGAKPGPCVALRADMDALPVKEEVDLPFASKVETEWSGQKVGVMHACGHDAHTSILMAVAEVLAGMREHIAGSVKFIFQPAEETPPIGEDGGAKKMIEEGCMQNPKVDAIFGLHISSIFNTGQLGYRPGPLMASADDFRIFVEGTQTHAAMPWRGCDPIVIGAQIVNNLQTIVSRRMNIAEEPSIVTVGTFHGGVRHNIIPDNVKMEGTIRTFNEAHRNEIHEHMKKMVSLIAEAGGGKANVHIHRWYDVTVNHEELTAWTVPHLKRVAGDANVSIVSKICGSEDFSFYQKEVPGFFYFMGCTPPDKDARYAAPNHSPRFYVDEDSLPLGVKTLAGLALSYLAEGAPVK